MSELDVRECPRCGEFCGRDDVDIGVGIKYGPWGCYSCGWSEDSDYDKRKDEIEVQIEKVQDKI